MHVGVAMFCTNYSIPPAALAQALERRGFDSMWAPEHSHIPVSRASAFPRGGALPQKYFDVMDPFVVLSAAATVTTRLKVATGICLVAQRDAIQTAKAVASLDQISGGRFVFGVGPGWNADEMANHGTEFGSRMKIMRERIEAMRSIWTEDVASYGGDTLAFDAIRAEPKPSQKPHPPVLIGGTVPYGARRAIAYGDGFIPHATRPDHRFLDRIDEYRAMEADAGRQVPITTFGTEHDPATWEAYAEAGIERIVLSVDSIGADALLPMLDAWAPYVARVSA
jgi:probable F420-dependent oxidoreductase